MASEQIASWGVVVLAAGQGTRMRSRRPKVLHELAGRPLVDHVVDLALTCAPARAVTVVVGHGADEVRRHLERRGVATVLQEPQLGTGDALRVALEATAGDPTAGVLVLSGDVPLLRGETLRELMDAVNDDATAALLTAVLAEPAGYGRVVRGDDGSVHAVVEARDADAAVLRLREVNAGVYAFRRRPVADAVSALRPDNAQGEYYLTDVVADLRRRGLAVTPVVLADPDDMRGVNTRADLARVEKICNARTLDGLMDSGVTIVDPRSTWVDASCRVEPDAVVEPGVVLRRGARVGRGARIGAHSVIEGCRVDAGEEVPPLTLRRGAGPAEGPDHG